MINRKGKHLTWNDRLTIERMILKGYSKREIADVIGCCLATIYNELKRATYLHTNYELIDEVRYNTIHFPVSAYIAVKYRFVSFFYTCSF